MKHRTLRTFAATTAGAILLSGASAVPAEAASLILQDAFNGANATVTPAGSTFQVSLLLDASAPGEEAVGLSYFLETLDSGSGRFRILNRSTTLSPFTALTTDNATALEAGNALLDPRNANDLGGLTASAAPVGSGFYRVARFTIEALTGTPLGTYTLQVAPDAVLTDGDFNDVPVTASSFTVTVAAAPEPGTLMLLLVAAVPLALRRRRN